MALYRKQCNFIPKCQFLILFIMKGGSRSSFPSSSSIIKDGNKLAPTENGMLNKKDNLLFISSNYLKMFIFFDSISQASEFLNSFLYKKNSISKELAEDSFLISSKLEDIDNDSQHLLYRISKRFQEALMDFLKEEADIQYELFSTSYCIKNFDSFFEILFDTIPCNASWESTSEFQDIFKNWVHSTYLTYTQSY